MDTDSQDTGIGTSTGFKVATLTMLKVRRENMFPKKKQEVWEERYTL